MNNCRVFVKGAGRKVCGKLVHDWEGPIRDAIKNVSSFYREVFNHVKTCDKCDPTEVLQAYWKLRQEKNKGKMSMGIAELAARYLRIGADPLLVKGFINDPKSVETALRCNQLFNDDELYDLMKRAYFNDDGLAQIHLINTEKIDKAMNKGCRPIVRNVLLFARHQVPLPRIEDTTIEEFHKMAVVAEVILS